MKDNKRNTINKHNFSYNTALEHAMRAIFEDVDINVDGQVYSYDKQHNILMIKDFCSEQKYKPKFNGMFCDPFAERIPEVINNEQ